MFADNPIMSWRSRNNRYLLEGVRCCDCAAVYYPQKYRCRCQSTRFEKMYFSGKGTIVSFTQVTVPPRVFAVLAPYNLGLIQLQEGARLIAQITDVTFEELFMGMKVVAAFRKYYVSGEKGIIHYGIKFVPER